MLWGKGVVDLCRKLFVSRCRRALPEVVFLAQGESGGQATQAPKKERLGLSPEV